MKKNLYLYITVGVLLVFTVLYFVIANNVSYAFNYNVTDYQYENKLFQIENLSKRYASLNKELFNEDETIYITVDDLVNSGLMPSEDGKVKDPRSNVLVLNELKIRITKDGDDFTVKVLV